MPRRPASNWWHHLPPAERRRRRLEVQFYRLSAWIRRRRNAILLLSLFYLGLCLIPLALGLPMLLGFAILPALLVPAVGFASYWLVWKEFHH
ncbi:MAG: hypothetical protein ACKO5F_13105 [Synechococcus sp.]